MAPRHTVSSSYTCGNYWVRPCTPAATFPSRLSFLPPSLLISFCSSPILPHPLPLPLLIFSPLRPLPFFCLLAYPLHPTILTSLRLPILLCLIFPYLAPSTLSSSSPTPPLPPSPHHLCPGSTELYTQRVTAEGATAECKLELKVLSDVALTLLSDRLAGCRVIKATDERTLMVVMKPQST